MSWINLTDGSFGGFRFHVVDPTPDEDFGVASINWKLSRRLQVSKKPLVSGGSVRDYGANEIPITFEVHFFGPNYQKKYNEFEEILNKGIAQELVIPAYPFGIQAYFSEADVRVSYEEHNCITMSCVFISDETIDEASVFASTKQLTREEIAQRIKALADEGNKALEANEFLQAVTAVESGISSVRRFANRVSTLESAVKNRIIGLKAQVEGALNQIKNVVSIIEEDESAATTVVASGFTEEDSDREIVNFSEDVIESEDVDEEEEFSEDLRNSVINDSGRVTVLKALKETVTISSTEMNENTEGQSEESIENSKSLGLTIDEYIKFFEEQERKKVFVVYTTSLMEIMFQNGIPVNDLKSVHSYNTHLEDTMDIPPGEVVYI